MDDSKKAFFLAVAALVLAGGVVVFALVGTPFNLKGLTGDLQDRMAQAEKNVAYLFNISLPVPAVTTPSGFVLEFSSGVTVYVAGDTGTDINFDMIKEFYSPEIFLVPAGGIFTVDGKGAAYLTSKIQPEVVLPYHYGSGVPLFPAEATYFLEEMNKLKSQGKTNAAVIVMEPGKELTVKGIKIVWLGHAGILFEGPKGSRIMTDPEWNYLNSVNYPADYKDSAQKGAADLIILTHGHADHFDFTALKELASGSQDHKPILFGVFELMGTASKHLSALATQMVGGSFGAPYGKSTFEARVGSSITLKDDVIVTLVWASHGPGMFLPVQPSTE